MVAGTRVTPSLFIFQHHPSTIAYTKDYIKFVHISYLQWFLFYSIGREKKKTLYRTLLLCKNLTSELGLNMVYSPSANPSYSTSRSLKKN